MPPPVEGPPPAQVTTLGLFAYRRLAVTPHYNNVDSSLCTAKAGCSNHTTLTSTVSRRPTTIRHNGLSTNPPLRDSRTAPPGRICAPFLRVTPGLPGIVTDPHQSSSHPPAIARSLWCMSNRAVVLFSSSRYALISPVSLQALLAVQSPLARNGMDSVTPLNLRNQGRYPM